MQIATPIPQLDAMNNKNGSAASTGDSFPGNQAGEKAGIVNLPEGLTAQAVISWCQTRRKGFETWFGPYKSAIEDYGRLYRTKNTARVKATYPNAVPISNSIVETAVARITPALFERPKLVECSADIPGADAGLVEAIEDFVNEQVSKSLNHPRVGADAVKSTCIEGTGFAKVMWKIDTVSETKPMIDKVTGQIIGEEQVDREISYADCEPLSIFNLAWEPRCSTNLQSSPWVSQRSWMSISDLYRMQKAGQIEGVEEIAKIVPSDVSAKDDWEKARKDSLAQGWSSYTYGVMSDEKVYKIDEWWACMNWKDAQGADQYDEFKFFIVEEQYLVFFDKNPFVNKWKPYVSFRMKINPRELLGESILAPVKDVQEMINVFAGKCGDLIDKAADTPTYYGKGSGISGRNYIVRTKGLIPVDDVSQIKEGTVNTQAIGVTQSYTDQLVDFMRQATPANDMAQGIGGSDTATEASILSQSAGARFSHSIGLLGAEFIREVAERFFWLYQQFGQDGQMFYRDEQDGDTKELKRADIQGIYRFVPTTVSSEQNKGIRVRQMQEFLKMAIETRLPLNIPEFVAKELMPLYGIPNGHSYLMQPQQMPMGMPGMPQGMPQGNPNMPQETPTLPMEQ